MEYLDRSDIIELMLSDYSILNMPLVRPVQNLHELHQVYRLAHNSYVAHGYTTPHPSQMLIHYPNFDHLSETTILIAMDHGRAIGSVSLTMDGPSGFTIDEDFKDTCDRIRQEGKPSATIWRLVVEESMRTRRTVVIQLINEVVRRLLEAKVASALFAVNPKHVDVYKRMLNMKEVDRKETTEGLRQAPAILLRGDPSQIPSTSVIDASAPGPSHSFNPIHFFLTFGKY